MTLAAVHGSKISLGDPIRIQHPDRAAAEPEPDPAPVASKPADEPDPKKPTSDPKRLMAFFGGLH